jgi:signal transduction histidine kinase
MVASGVAWFVPNFTPHLLYLHRGPLVQLVLAFPHGRPRRGWELMAVCAGWAVAFATPVWQSATVTLVLATLLALLASVGFHSSVGLERRERAYALRATTLLAGVLAVPAALHLALPNGAGSKGGAALHFYEGGLIFLALLLLWWLLRHPWRQVTLTDMVIELGEAQAGTLKDALARALGDPSLEVGYRLEDGAGFADSRGQPLELPTEQDERSMTLVHRDGEPVAVLIYDPAILGDPALAEAVASATRLSGEHARLQAELQVRINELAASRRRILAARDEERSRLEERLREGAQRRLTTLAETLAASRLSSTSPQTVERITQAEQQLRRTVDELTRFAHGIHPRELGERGLAAALSSLAVDFPLPVQLNVPPLEASPALEACIYFVCSEALSNVAKYAAASSVAISIAADAERVTLIVDDDGAGGADLEHGTGLRGLADRVQALGGLLTVYSPPGGGTRLTVVLPANA